MAVVAAAVLLVAVVGVVAVRLLTGGGPDDVARRFVEAGLDNDYETSCELLSPDLRKNQVDGLEGLGATDCASFAEQAEKLDRKQRDRPYSELDEGSDCSLTILERAEKFDHDVEITQVREDGDRATVEYRVTSRFTGSGDELRDCTDDDSRESDDTGALVLRRYDGDWRVSYLGEQGG